MANELPPLRMKGELDAMPPDKWAAAFISDLSLHILNEDYEALAAIKAKADEIGSVRATLLVNFGEGRPANTHGFSLQDEGSTHDLMVKVLKHLTTGKGKLDAVTVDVLATMGRIIHGVLKLAVEKSPEAAVSMVADYLEECGADDDETTALLKAWWQKAPGLRSESIYGCQPAQPAVRD